MNQNEMLRLIRTTYNEIGETNSSARSRVGRELYPLLPSEKKELLLLFDFLMDQQDYKILWLVTNWIKRKELYSLGNMDYYEKWLYEYIDDWGSCDLYCYRVLNPMVDRYPQLYKKVLEWTESSKTYVRRAAPVSLLESTRSFKVNYSYPKVINVVDKLKDDQEIHVQKGVGWLLKYAYLAYPEEVYNYLKDNVDNLPRVIFRYALEKAPETVKTDLMSLS